MERIISRADLLAEEPSPPSSPDLPAIQNLQEFDFVHHETLPDAPEAEHDDDEGEGLAFQLFAPTPGKSDNASGIAKIRLDSPEVNAEPGLVNPNRDRRYYFSSTPSAEEQQNFEAAALSGEQVFARSQTPWPGMSYSWKVLQIPRTRKQQQLLAPSNALFTKLIGKDVDRKRTRPGKKARIAVRTRLAAAKAKEEEKQKAAEIREAEEREKRTRRNREKKVKKKNREKAKKAEAGSTNAGGEEKEEEEDQHDESD